MKSQVVVLRVSMLKLTQLSTTIPINNAMVFIHFTFCEFISSNVAGCKGLKFKNKYFFK